MRQNGKRRKLLVCLGISLMLAGAAAGCNIDRDRESHPRETVRKIQEGEKGICLPGGFVFDMIYPFHLGHKLVVYYFYYAYPWWEQADMPCR